jgi:predicted anti-sigma-YlaC factor YlaD
MTCDLCRELLSAQIDEEITETEAQAVQAHLAHCAVCQAFVARLRILQTTLLTAVPPAQPQALQARIRKHIGIGKVSTWPLAEVGSILGRHGIPLRLPQITTTTGATSFLGRN